MQLRIYFSTFLAIFREKKWGKICSFEKSIRFEKQDLEDKKAGTSINFTCPSNPRAFLLYHLYISHTVFLVRRANSPRHFHSTYLCQLNIPECSGYNPQYVCPWGDEAAPMISIFLFNVMHRVFRKCDFLVILLFSEFRN